jgi:hypothetical protein
VPPSGGESAHQRAALELRGAEVLVKLVADALIRLGLGLAPGALLLADLASALWARGVPRRRGQETLPHPPRR